MTTWGDVQLKSENGKTFSEFNEQLTKTRTGNTSHTRAFAPKFFENTQDPSRCPVQAYREYASKRQFR
jgi:hypothetical protein